MRPAIVVLAMITAGGLPVAFADPPATPVAANPTPGAPDEPMALKLLRDEGYKPAMRNGEKVYCRREIPLGSRLPTTLKCVTVAEAELMAKEARETAEHVQRNMAGCLTTADTHRVNCGGK